MLGDVDKWLDNKPQKEKSEILSGLIIYLTRADKIDKASSLLLDYSFVEQKIIAFGPQLIIEDYKLVIDLAEVLNEERSKSLNILVSAIQQSAHIIENNRDQIASQLRGYIDTEATPAINEFLKCIDAHKSKTWLRPVPASLQPFQGTLNKVLSGHLSDISAVYVNNKKNQIISGTEHGEIKIWDIEKSECLSTFNCKKEEEVSFLIEAQERFVLALSKKDKTNTLSIWDKQNGNIIKTISGTTDNMIETILLTKNEDHVITMDPKNNTCLILWELPSLSPAQKIKHTNRVFDFSLYNHVSKEKRNLLRYLKLGNDKKENNRVNKDRLITSSGIENEGKKASFKLFEQHNNKGFKFYKHIDPYIKDARNFIIHKELNRIILWNYYSVRVIDIDKRSFFDIEVSVGDGNFVSEALIVKKGTGILIFSGNSKAWLYELKTRKLINTFIVPENHEIEVITKDKLAILWGLNGELQTWDLENATITGKLNGWNTTNLIKGVSDRFIISNDNKAKLNIWSLDKIQSDRNSINHSDVVTSVKTFNDGKTCVTTSFDKDIKLIDLKNSQLTQSLDGHKSNINCIDIYQNNNDYYAISASGFFQAQECELKIWNLLNGTCVRTLELFEHEIKVVKAIKKGRVAITMDCEFQIDFVDLVNEEIMFSYNYSPRDELLDSTVKSINQDIDLGQNYLDISPSLIYMDHLIEVFDHDKKLLVGYYDGSLKIIDTSNGYLIEELVGHTECITSLEIDYDGNYAVTGSADKTVKLWDLKKFKCVLSIDGHTSDIKKARFVRIQSKDKSLSITKNSTLTFQSKKKKNTHILSASHDGAINLWEISTRKCIMNRPSDTRLLKDLIPFEKSSRGLIVTVEGGLIIFDLLTGQTITSLSIGRSISKVTVTEDERTIIVGERSGQIHLIEITEGHRPTLKVVYRTSK